MAVSLAGAARAGAICSLALWLSARIAHAGSEGGEAQAAYDAGRFDQARILWERAANNGDARALFGLGLLYDLGQGVAARETEAYGWYLRAAECGMADAEFNVAVMNDSGRGTPHDAAAAAIWYGRAAAHGHVRAEYDLAQLYEAGEGVPSNREAAMAWYEAAAASLPAAAHRLALLRKQRDPPSAQAGALTTLTPPVPAVGTSGSAFELVWTAPPQPVRVRYFISVLAVDGAKPKSVFSSYADRSAILMPERALPCPCVWRVYAIGLGTGHYAASPWRELRS